MLFEAKNEYALVLSGGGAKGAYQIGAWKALNCHGIRFSAVSGASVGALNAALVAQGDFDTADRLWKRIKIDNVVNVPPEFVSKGKIKITARALKSMTRTWEKGLLLDSSPLKKLIGSTLNEYKIRKKGMDLGVVTINRSSFRTVEIFLDQIEEGLLTDYLFASASFPAFKNAEIKGDKYIDGGIHDNIPFSMLKNRGYRRFIIIDISGPGFNRKPDIIGTDTVYIKNSMELGGVLDFSRKTLEKSSDLGFLDTDKIFGGNEGIKYFFKPDFHEMKKIAKCLELPEIKSFIDLLADRKKNSLKKILPDEYKEWRYPVFALLECAALSLGIERIKLYDFSELLTLVRDKYLEIGNELFVQDIKMPYFDEMGRIIKEISSGKSLSDYPPFAYYRGAEVLSGTDRLTIEKNALFVFYPYLRGAVLFFKILSEYFKTGDK